MQELINLQQLEFLTKLGAEETTIDILGTKFKFRTLNVEENTNAFENPTKEKYEDDIAKFNAMRVEILSRAILSVNDYEIPEAFRVKLKTILKKMQQAALNKLFASYQDLVAKQETNMADVEEKALTETEIAMEKPSVSVPEIEEKPKVAVRPANKPINIVNPDELMSENG